MRTGDIRSKVVQIGIDAMIDKMIRHAHRKNSGGEMRKTDKPGKQESEPEIELLFYGFTVDSV